MRKPDQVFVKRLNIYSGRKPTFSASITSWISLCCSREKYVKMDNGELLTPIGCPSVPSPRAQILLKICSSDVASIRGT